MQWAAEISHNKMDCHLALDRILDLSLFTKTVRIFSRTRDSEHKRSVLDGVVTQRT